VKVLAYTNYYGEEPAKEFADGKQQASLLPPVLDALITLRHFLEKGYAFFLPAKMAFYDLSSG
jgi:hypothetical protein